MAENRNITKENFLKTVQLLIEKPHILNKQFSGFNIKGIGQTTQSSPNIEIIYERLKDVTSSDKHAVDVNFLVDILVKEGISNLGNEVKNERNVPWDDIPLFDVEFNSSLIIIRNIFLKDVQEGIIISVILIDPTRLKVVFCFISNSIREKVPILDDFSMQLQEGKILLQPLTCDYQKREFWLTNHLLPTILKFSSQMDNQVKGKRSIQSLSLLEDLQRYHSVYLMLKRKYSQHLIDIWSEVTDPLKFIYEDLAIAAYLVVLWEQERRSNDLKQKQSFIDIGCGNGLLVYILASEGYPGMGIDIRKRKLWSQFPSYVHLKEEAIVPSDKHLYPDFDWLIGNHSDELTPWLPVIAAKSSPTCSFFVIPCCPFDFQSKFQRKKAGMSHYAEYLDYVAFIGTECGFEVRRDRLRIPSTKRTCFVGRRNSSVGLRKEDWFRIVKDIDAFVGRRCEMNRHFKVNKDERITEEKLEDFPVKRWCGDFKPRNSIQETKNCTHINSEVRDDLLSTITTHLLSKQNVIEVLKNGETIKWNRGGQKSMRELVTSLNSYHLKHLKNECGGLQTFIRNHRFIFEWTKGEIQLRIPEPIEKRNISPDLIRTKRCWFYDHHPQGCTLPADKCTYAH